MNYDVHRHICAGTIEVASWASKSSEPLRNKIFGPFQVLGKLHGLHPQPTWRMVPYRLYIENPWSYAQPKSMFIVFQ